MSDPKAPKNEAKPAGDIDVNALIASAIANYAAGEKERTDAAVAAALDKAPKPVSVDVDALVATAISNYAAGEVSRTNEAIAAALSSNTLPASLEINGVLEVASTLTKEDAAALVKRVVIVPPAEKGDEPTTVTKPIEAAEVLDFKDLGKQVVVVTIDGHKFYGDKLAA